MKFTKILPLLLILATLTACNSKEKTEKNLLVEKSQEWVNMTSPVDELGMVQDVSYDEKSNTLHFQLIMDAPLSMNLVNKDEALRNMMVRYIFDKPEPFGAQVLQSLAGSDGKMEIVGATKGEKLELSAADVLKISEMSPVSDTAWARTIATMQARTVEPRLLGAGLQSLEMTQGGLCFTFKPNVLSGEGERKLKDSFKAWYKENAEGSQTMADLVQSSITARINWIVETGTGETLTLPGSFLTVFYGAVQKAI